ncbi:hypothetical protein A2Y99_01330 [Candidatus Gottesmanbacteria bacterium RBG_13_37_7]|uniref:PD-(D/E)XK endonuclease-like domain-containing protein n=1 Tax=Candidatus Gottesmanbacteria bacterium RBG_13_37_7 TaxID=1798369 RepID=A0A1F5YIG7_9BACT|nr:MAG: hypothetical protein A2Y99_01330 [Candidatus Gottesmanbacteria bacterium RBG_13_37_7]
MTRDKYSAVWVSHSSISDFIKCPKAYYYHNVYRNPKSGNKVTLINPPLALGQTVHEVLESLSSLPVEKRFREPLMSKFDLVWKKVSGEKGGFENIDEEYKYKKRGMEMIRRVWESPGPLAKLAVKIKMDLPYFWLSEEDNIILCGKIDWLEYLSETDSIHIIDFKTSKKEENNNSLQLSIYYLLVQNCQKRNVTVISYWYLDKDKLPQKKSIPDMDKSREEILKIAKEIKLARQLSRFVCPKKTGCIFCKPFEQIVSGNAELVGLNNYRQEVYVLNKSRGSESKDSIII